MSGVYFAIVDSEPGFAKNLASGFLRYEKTAYVVHSFESRDAFMKQDPLSYDVLLINYKDTDTEFREYIDRKKQNTGKPEMILMTESKEEPVIDGFRAVYKYQQIRQLVKDTGQARLFERKKFDIRKEGDPEVSVLGIAGAVGRCGKTTFALALALKLAENGRVLFANFDICTSLKAMLKEILPEEGKDIADLIYALRYKKEETDLSEYLCSYQGLDIICPVHMQEDLYKTDPYDFIKLILDMVKICKYETVVLDLGENLCITERFLPHITRLYIPTRADPLSSEKTACFRDWINRMDNTKKPLCDEVLLPAVHPFYSGRNYLSQIKWSDLGKVAESLLIQEGDDVHETEKPGNDL